jgi:hypothetical protein
VWYHNKDLKAENLDDSDALLSAGADEYLDLIVATTEEQQLSPPFSEGDQGFGAAEENLFASAERLNFNAHEDGFNDFEFSVSNAANPFITLPAFTDNDLLPTFYS